MNFDVICLILPEPCRLRAENICFPWSCQTMHWLCTTEFTLVLQVSTNNYSPSYGSMIRFILVQVRCLTYNSIKIIIFSRYYRIDKARRDYQSGMCLMTTMKKWVPFFILNFNMPLFWLFFSISFHSLQQHKVRLRGEVHRLVAPRDQKYQSNFVEVRLSNRLLASYI